MPLNIIVVGAGIGGLCTAVALHQAGHSVKVFEKSRFLGEAGAALSVAPNGGRVLSQLGFDFKRARAMELKTWSLIDGITLDPIAVTDLSDRRERYGNPFYVLHRADLHGELVRLASLKGSDLNVQVAAKVTSANAEEGFVELEDGTRHYADLIIAADGIHSVLRSVVAGEDQSIKPTGLSAFRFLIPTSDIKDDPHFVELQKLGDGGSTIAADTTQEVEHHLVWYECQDGEVQNFVGIHKQTAEVENLKQSMMAEFRHYHPSLVHLISRAGDVTDWPLFIHDPLPQWHRDKLLIIGDAAHPMLPFGGQGSNQAVEDAGALGILLDGASPSDVPQCLQQFEKVRRLRASRTQVLSKVRINKEMEVHEELKQYADPPGSDLPTTMKERFDHDQGFDVIGMSRKVKSQDTGLKTYCMDH